MLKKCIVIISILLTAAMPGIAAEVSIAAAADKQKVTIGDPVSFTVTVSHPAGCAVAPAPAAALGGWEIVDSTATRQDTPAGSQSQLHYTLMAFTTGQMPIPAVTVKYRDAAGNGGEVTSAPVPVTIESVIGKQNAAGDIRDIKPPLTLPLPWWVYLAWLAGICAAGGGLYYWYTHYRRRADTMAPVPEVPPVPPYQAAIEALERLQAAGLVEAGKIKEYYIALADVIRVYLGAVYAIETMDKTTAEIYGQLRAAEPDKKKLLPVREFFDACDLVKFAKFRPDETVCRQDWEAAKRIVEQ